jgi:hypothetical protein
MTTETIKAAYKENCRSFEVKFSASKKAYDAGFSYIANGLYRQADNHRRYMRLAIMPRAWLKSI